MKVELDEDQLARAMEELERAISLIGGPKETANAIGYSVSGMRHWRNTGRIPGLAAKRIDEITDDYIDKATLRPDLWPKGDNDLVPIEDAIDTLIRQGVTSEDYEKLRSERLEGVFENS